MPDILRDNPFERKLLAAKQGRKFWLSMVENGDVNDKTFVFLFLGKDTECATLVFKNLTDFMELHIGNDLLFLWAGDKSKRICTKEFPRAECFLKSVKREIAITDGEAENLLAYYTLKEFTDRLIVASLSFPEGRHGMDAIGIQEITEEEAVRIGILGLPG